MRDLVVAVGGPLDANENRKSWLVRVSECAGISFRVAAAAFYGEHMSKETENKLKAAAASYEAKNLAFLFEHFVTSLNHRNENLRSEDAAALVHTIRVLRGMGGAGDSS